VKTICWQSTNQPLEELLLQLNQMLGGWTAYFRWGCSSATFRYLRAYLWKRVTGWQGRKHRHTTWRAAPPLRQVAHRRRCDPVRSGEGAHQALPLSGDEDSVTVAQHSMRT
jgi:Group II intron, maturase-specific domain